MGRDYALSHFDCPIGLQIHESDSVGDKIFIEGNSAAALGAVYGGATVAAWYPITPSTSLAEAFERHCKKFRHDKDTGRARYAILQAEDRSDCAPQVQCLLLVEAHPGVSHNLQAGMVKQGYLI